MTDSELWHELGQQLRVDSIRCSAVPKSGHPTSSMSAADLMAVLISKYLRYDFDEPENPANDNLIAILDINRLGQRGQTMHGWDLDSYTRRVEAFGWNAIEIDGHDLEEIDRAYEDALSMNGRPTAIVARTIKGKGVKAVENKD